MNAGDGALVSVCSSCGDPIEWVKSVSDRSVPLDPGTDETRGRWIRENRSGRYRRLKSDRERLDHYGRGVLRSNHVETCRNRKRGQ